MVVACMLVLLALLVGWLLWAVSQCNPDDEQD
jgi:hypothetical protein